ncbi:MAG: hypothetical protein MMC33_009742 [Icmadophila ericetorum]|nr:hypothetical protein [Icmadophila ericetorum]
MEFAQYYPFDQPEVQFAADPSYYSSEPPLPQQQQHQQRHFESPSINSTASQSNQRQEEGGVPMQKDSEETDTSSRPRLTTEQTNILEENFQKESKPVTEVKRQLAARVGLPLDKVNNWYQNRRAKAKHLRKQEILEVMHVHQLNPPLPWQDYGAGMISPAFSPNEYPSDMTTSMQVPMQDYPSYHVPSGAPQFTTLHQQCFSWNGMLETRASQLGHGFLGSESSMEHKIPENANSHLSMLSHTQSDTSHGNCLAASTFSDWGSNHTTPAIWTPNHPQENPFENQSLVHQHSMASSVGTDHSMQHSTTSSPDSVPIYQTEILAPNPQHAPPPILTQSHEQTFSQSPEPSPFTSLPTQPPPGNFSRRGSNSSDLATTFNTFHLQKGESQQSQQNSDEDVFKTPPIPSLNLAARRKKNRPPPLGAAGMRSQSCTGPQNSSPITKTASMGQSPSVRRIKSTGNSLNVISNGRIQKSGVGPAQKSPLHFTTFHESGAFDNVDAITSQQPSGSQTPSNSQGGPLTPHTPSGMDGQPSIWSKSTMQVETGPLSQEQPFSTASYAASGQVTSPPHTPFIDVPSYVSQLPHYGAAPPQSAPAHISTFQPTQFIPQSSLDEPYIYYHMPQMYQQPLSMIHLSQSQPNFFSYTGPQIMSDSPTMGGYSNFYANPVAPPTKEVEFVLQTFPQPKEGAPPPSKEPHRPKQYVFQNAGPSDF